MTTQVYGGYIILNQDNKEKNITGFNENDLLKKKENLYLLNIFSLSFILFVIVINIFRTADLSISYFLSLISSVLIFNGYNQVKKENKN